MKKLIICLSLLATGLSQAQNFPARTPTPNDTLVSARILSDSRLRFSIYAPKATEVTVNGDFLAGQPAASLTKQANGVWTTTIGPLAPNLYTYDFTVDGIKTFDPKNPQYKESLNGLSNLVTIPGKETDYLSEKNVPHGRVEIVWYPSASLGITRRMHVYTPPGYEKSTAKLPVLYLLHGGGDNDASWMTVGRANFILDNLLAEGKMKPMLVVMPAGHTPTPGIHMGAGPEQDPFCIDFLGSVMPFIEKQYRVSTRREDRAIAGLSMGGIQVLNIALWHPEKFNYVIPLSTGYFPPVIKELEEKYQAVLKNQEINRINLLWIAMGGPADIAYQNNKNMMALFDKNQIKYQYVEVPGGHSFLAWRNNLHTFAPLLFR
ncbi:esterase [Spirosoma linguale]|uniref:Esterase n=1 Tax=Spirosoma linguale (strain ATCC 33905 / DSM 74 / LMG 10896 / Claus 1) TaxID=504472 RepID=D2QL67_SPILD|nr:putative esterase [Spirosoma linguale DSM 74]